MKLVCLKEDKWGEVYDFIAACGCVAEIRTERLADRCQHVPGGYRDIIRFDLFLADVCSAHKEQGWVEGPYDQGLPHDVLRELGFFKALDAR